MKLLQRCISNRVVMWVIQRIHVNLKAQLKNEFWQQWLTSPVNKFHMNSAIGIQLNVIENHEIIDPLNRAETNHFNLIYIGP